MLSGDLISQNRLVFEPWDSDDFYNVATFEACRVFNIYVWMSSSSQQSGMYTLTRLLHFSVLKMKTYRSTIACT